MRGLSEDERALLTHWSLYGSDGYPITKLRRGWVWSYRSVQGPPVVFRTKRDAVASFEAFIDVLIRASGEERQAEALADLAAREVAR